MVLTFKEFSAWITIDGQTLDEYCVENLAGNTVTCWIPSQVDREFQVHWRDSAKKTSTDGVVFLDGRNCGGKVLSQDRDKPDTACKIGIRTMPNVVVPFKFGSAKFTDDEERADPSATVRNTGIIDLCIFRVIVRKREEHIIRKAHEDRLLDEKTMKGIQHQTTFGEAQMGQARNAVKVSQVSETPIVRFRFQYRPIEMLQADGKAPRPQSVSMQTRKLKKEEHSEKVPKPSSPSLGSFETPIIILDDEDSLPTPRSPSLSSQRPLAGKTSRDTPSRDHAPLKKEQTETPTVSRHGRSKEQAIVIDDDDEVEIPSSSSTNIKPEVTDDTVKRELSPDRVNTSTASTSPQLSSSIKDEQRGGNIPQIPRNPKQEENVSEDILTVAASNISTSATRDPRLSARHPSRAARHQKMTDNVDITTSEKPTNATAGEVEHLPPQRTAYQTPDYTPSISDTSRSGESQTVTPRPGESIANVDPHDDPETTALKARLEELKRKREEREREQEARKKLKSNTSMSVTDP